jgi:hypothetical protein
MSYVSGKRVASILLPCFGIFIAVFGLVMAYIIPVDIPIMNLIGNIILLIGVIMIFAGIAYYPSGKQESKQIRSIVEIVAVRKQVSISDISEETGLDREYIRKIITNMLIAHALFGYLEDDLFVRDTAGRPLIYYGRHVGLSDVSE